MQSSRRKPIEKILVIADPHAGSTVGLMPPDFRTLEGNKIGQNALQEFLWRCWLDCEPWAWSIIGTAPFALVFNGDCTEGDHHGTKQIWSKNITDHVNCANKLFGPLAKAAAKVFIVQGTECHTNSSEYAIAEKLRAVVNPETVNPEDPEGSPRIFDRLTIDVHGVRCVFRHHIGVTFRSYLSATQFAVTINEEKIEAVNNGEVAPRVVCCAHRHRYGKWDDGFNLCVVSPPWQGITRHVHKVVSAARCHPGAYILDWSGLPRGSLPAVHSTIYEAPRPIAIKL